MATDQDLAAAGVSANKPMLAPSHPFLSLTDTSGSNQLLKVPSEATETTRVVKKDVVMDHNTVSDFGTILSGDNSSVKGDGNDNHTVITQNIYMQGTVETACDPDGRLTVKSVKAVEVAETTIARLPDSTVNLYAQSFADRGQVIENRYKELHEATKKNFKSTYKPSRKEINDQRARFAGINSKLVKILQLSYTASESPSWEAEKEDTLQQIRDELTRLTEALQDLQQALRDRNADLEFRSTEQSRYRDPFMEDLAPIQRRLDKFEALARSIIGDRWSMRDQPAPAGAALEKLSVEGRATARLYHCLGQCCPIAAIDHAHTAIMSLKSKMLLDDEDTADSATSTSMVTECHMAIKSTARENSGLIWLKVKSIMAWEQLALGDAAAPDATSPTSTSPTSEFRASKLTKRKRSSSPESPSEGGGGGPLLKMPRYDTPQPASSASALLSSPPTPLIRRTSDSNTEVSSGSWYPVREVRVCPACLAPNTDVEDDLLCRSTAAAGTTTTSNGSGPGGGSSDNRGLRARLLNQPVMRLEHGDGSLCQHQLFYLPPGQRPAAGAPRLTLGQVLEERARRRHVFGRRGWVARVARLVAESVLRFDWRDARRGPRVENLVFYESAAATASSFEPFLEVQFDSHSSHLAAGAVVMMGQQDSLSSRLMVLLNLGHILLELGSPDPPGVYTAGWDVRQHRVYLNNLSREGVATSKGMGGKYAQVIRNCANFDIPTLKEDRNVVNEDEFRENYFSLIVSPLRKLEDEFPEDTQTGQQGRK